MFVATPGNQVIAIDAKSGNLLWRYKRPIPDDMLLLHPTSRGVALYGDKVYFAAGEAVLVALDAKTGKEVWTTTVADNNHGYYMSLAPLVADGKVMVGARAASSESAALSPRSMPKPARSCGGPTRCRRPASRAARPGPRATNGRPAAARCGSPAITIPRPISPTGAPAMAGRGWATSARATISTPRRSLALDVATGKIKGYHQYHPNDSWDWDEVSPPILVDYQHNGKTDQRSDRRRARRLSVVPRADPTARYQLHRRQAVCEAERVQEPRSRNRAAERRPGAQARNRQKSRFLPVAVGRQELAADRLQPEDADDLHPGQ